MSQPSTFDHLVDLFLLRISPRPGSDDQPYYTTGSIMAAAVMRLAVVGALAWYFVDAYGSKSWWWTVVMFAAWGVGVFPAYLQYRRFNENVRSIQNNTLCGTCRHFNPTNQLCSILDVHVTSAEPPCEGDGWEPL